jgi:hypothetical protein
MKKKNVGIIGCGRWGKKVIEILANIANIKFICNSKNNYKDFYLRDIEWVFILTPDKTHNSIVEYCIKKKCNVFCEKPLTMCYHQSDNLYNLAKNNKVKLYVDDVENYKKKKFFIKKNNLIIRKKKDIGPAKSLLYRLAYHDFYLLYRYLIPEKFLKFNAKIDNHKLLLSIEGKKIFNFIYDINSKNKIHTINNCNFLNFDCNPLKDMLLDVLYSKKNFIMNKKISLFSNLIIDKFLEEMKK